MQAIDPTQVTNFNRDNFELQQFMLFCVLVAGKNSKIQSKKLDEFLGNGNVNTPFCFMDGLRDMNALHIHMERCKLGQYNRLEKTFGKLLDAWRKNPYFLRTIGVGELQDMVGLKTSRFFLVHSRPSVRAAILDTHILAWMREECRIAAPKATPSSKNVYLALESLFLRECDNRGKTVAEMDLDIWKSRQHDVNLS